MTSSSRDGSKHETLAVTSGWQSSVSGSHTARINTLSQPARGWIS